MEPEGTPGLELRNKYTREQPSRENHHDDEYIDKLKTLGIEVHPSLSPAYFTLKNGLEYPGIVTRDLISKDTVLVKVPEKMILSSMKALKEPALQEIYKDPFYNEHDSWEDRVLLTYCLFLVSTEAKDNIFYEMIQHMSKDIDVAYFWPKEELDLFKDPIVKGLVEKDLKSFE